MAVSQDRRPSAASSATVAISLTWERVIWFGLNEGYIGVDARYGRQLAQSFRRSFLVTSVQLPTISTKHQLASESQLHYASDHQGNCRWRHWFQMRLLPAEWQTAKLLPHVRSLAQCGISLGNRSGLIRTHSAQNGRFPVPESFRYYLGLCKAKSNTIYSIFSRYIHEWMSSWVVLPLKLICYKFKM